MARDALAHILGHLVYLCLDHYLPGHLLGIDFDHVGLHHDVCNHAGEAEELDALVVGDAVLLLLGWRVANYFCSVDIVL